MKKIVLAFLAVIVTAVSLVFILIPNRIIVSTIVYTNYKPAVVLRCLHENADWQRWFPGKKDAANNFYYNDQQYTLSEKTYASINISIEKNNSLYASQINVLPINFDSSAVQWELELTSSNNPFKRIETYQTAKKIKENIAFLLDSFKTFIQSTKNIYGFDIKRSTLTDTTLVSIRSAINEYPSTDFIYELVFRLRIYIKQQNASEHNYPMLNTTLLKDSTYEVMVGIPTNIPLPGNSVIKPKRMVMLENKTLVTTIIGDYNAIQRGFKATSNYMNDNGLSSPVIPFQQLVTDRSKEKDSTKWITKIFTPVS